MDILETKARLVLGGDITIPEGFEHPYIELREGAPHSMVISFGGTRVRKKVSADGQFELRADDGRLSVYEGDEMLADDVGIVRMFGHSPDTVTVVIDRKDHTLTVGEALAVMDSYSEMDPIRGVTIHGERCDIDLYTDVVRAYRDRYPAMTIGVGAHPGAGSIPALKDAGADNIKFGSKSVSDIDAMRQDMEQAVGCFGKGNVVCTVHLGKDMSDDSFLDMISGLCSIGVMPDIKVKRSVETKEKEASPERYCRILRATKGMMAENGLDPSGFDTLCYGCRLCTIVPFKDFRSRIAGGAGRIRACGLPRSSAQTRCSSSSSRARWRT
jgi:hypothetical protein